MRKVKYTTKQKEHQKYLRAAAWKTIRNKVRKVRGYKCEICGSPATETHHLNEQQLADENNFINSIHKNHQSNLIGICEKCHKNIHKKI